MTIWYKKYPGYCGQILILIFFLALPGCTSIFFMPMEQEIQTPARLNLSYQDVYFHTSDGLVLHGWFLPAEGESQGTVLFLHGNAENISTHLMSVYWLPQQHFNVFLFDYRGYGQSEGTPSIGGLITDSESALHYVINRPDINSDKLIVWGQSLGASIAVYTVAHSPERKRIKALIVDSAFTAYRKIAQEKLADIWLTWPLQWPLSWLFYADYTPIKAIKRISPVPVLIIHGEKDEIVPFSHGIRLYEAAGQPKQIWLLPNAKHIQDTLDQGFRLRLVAYMQQSLVLRTYGDSDSDW